MEDGLIETLRELIEPGDLIEYRGVTPKKVYKVVDVFPSSMLWTNEQGDSLQINWTDFIEARDWKAKDRPRLVKHHDTEEYKRRSTEFDAMLKEMEEECDRDPKAFFEK